jgi:hypothetical protein
MSTGGDKASPPRGRWIPKDGELDAPAGNGPIPFLPNQTEY